MLLSLYLPTNPGKVQGWNHDGVKYVGFHQMWMGDWDVPNEGHKTQECITVYSKEDAVGRLLNYCQVNPAYKFRVYETPGGVRAFCVSHVIPVFWGSDLHVELACDPMYRKLCQRTGRYPCRVSPKVGRPNDYVAEFIGNVGKGQEDPRLMKLVNFHDKLCNKYAQRALVAV